MRIPRIYLPLAMTVGATVTLPGPAFHHLARVLRLRAGATLILFDGAGKSFMATLTEVEKREAEARITAVLPGQTASPPRIVLAQGVSRGEKMDDTVRKAVELGATAIQPLFAEQGGVALVGERLARKIQHWQGIIIGACEQCGRNRLPELRQPANLADWLERSAEPGLRLLLDPAAAQGLRGLPTPADAITLLIGPEGGLSAEEVAQARAAGFIGVRLGPRVLRTETAGLAALAAVQTLWGDWD